MIIIGQVYSFSINPNHHIARVQVMEQKGEGDDIYFVCRRCDSGAVVLARLIELSDWSKK